MFGDLFKGLKNKNKFQATIKKAHHIKLSNDGIFKIVKSLDPKRSDKKKYWLKGFVGLNCEGYLCSNIFLTFNINFPSQKFNKFFSNR